MSTQTEALRNGDGSTATFTFPFEYLEESDVKVEVGGVLKTQNTHYTFSSLTEITFTSGNIPPSGTGNIRIFRLTDTAELRNEFFAGSAIRAQDLNDDFLQNLYRVQEISERALDSNGSTTTGDLTFNNANIVFEGSTEDDFETTLTVVDPTADRTITLPNAGGHAALFTADPGSTTISATPAELNTLDGITASTAELNLLDGVTATTAELNLLDGVTSTTAELNILDGVTATATELNLLDGVTATTAELNFVDGVTSNVQTQLDNKQPLDAELTELATMGSTTASALADLTQAEVQILDGATVSTAELNLLDGVTATTGELNHVDGVTSNIQTQLNDKQPLDAELTELATMASGTASALADLSQAEVQILDGATVTTAELNFVDGVTSNVQTQLDNKQPLDSELTELATMGSTTASALADLTQAEVQILDGATVTTAELNKLDGVTASTTELNALDGITSTVTELNLLDGVTATTAELNILDGVTATASELNQLDGNTLSSSSTDFTSSTQYPSAAEIDARITARIDPIGGFEAIADEDSFPATAPPEGTVVSIANANGLAVNASGVGAGTRAGGSDAVVINGFPSEFNSTSLDSGIGLLVIATSTAHTYDFHRVVAKNEDVRQLSSDINDFKARYRVGSSNPTTSLDEGDLFYNTGSDKMLVYDGSAWEEVQSIGEYFIIPASELADFASGTASTEVISNAPANASQIILSINGVIQEPNSGTTAPTDGFALDGSTIRLAATPPASSEVWGVIIGSTVNIGTPSAGTVGTTQLADDGVTGAKIADDAIDSNHYVDGSIDTAHIGDNQVTAAKLADTAVTAGSYTLSSITVDAQGRITAASSGSAGASTLQAVTDQGATTSNEITVDGLNIGGGPGTGSNNTRVGSDALDANTSGNENTAIGNDALNSNTEGSGNTAAGSLALEENTTGGNNTAIGINALRENVAGSSGTAIGNESQRYANSTTTGFTNNNVSVGHQSLRGSTTAANNTGTGNTAVGYTAMLNNTSGSNNTALGIASLDANTTGSSNVGLGRNALGSNTTGDENVAIGQSALGNSSTSDNNTAVGHQALNDNSSGTNNTGIGRQALKTTNSGSSNTAVGSSALLTHTSGSNNIGIGYQAGQSIQTGSNNTIIGSINGTSGLANTVIIGAGTTERMRIDSNGRLLIGTTASVTRDGAVPFLQVESSNSSAGAAFTRYSNDAVGPLLLLSKARGSVGGNTIVQNNDALGTILFHGADGNDQNSKAASISAAVDGTPGSNDMPARLVFSTAADGAQSPTERMRITSAGYVGINTNSPDSPLVVKEDSNKGIKFLKSDDSVLLDIKDDGSSNATLNAQTAGLKIETGGTERMRVNSSGHLVPGANNTYDLGTSSTRWRNVYTNDLNLSNEGSNNDVDGTWGSWTIQEGEDDLFLLNRRNGKKYKFNLTEVN